MFDLRTFSLADMFQCSADLRALGEVSSDADDAADRVISYLFEHLRSPKSDAPQCVLIRLFQTRPLSALDADEAAIVARAIGPDADPSTPCLSLRASRGLNEEWNKRSLSRRHRVIPLTSRTGGPLDAPMLARLISDLGADRLFSGSSSKLDDEHCPLFDVFYVEEALGSPLVPDQAEFVERYDVDSVLGFGGVVPPERLFAVVLFANVAIPRATADLFRTLAPSVGLALLAPARDVSSLEARVRSYELLVRHHETVALQHHRQLGQIAEQLTASLADRERLLAGAQEARSAAQAASRAKDEFLAALGHELRNPLAPILSAVELMGLRGARCREVEIVERQALHLARLVDDLLDVARIGRGKLEVQKAPVELAVVVGRAVEIVSPAFERRHQRLVVDVPREGLLVNADTGRLAQVVSNLLDNASKYSDPGTEVVLSVERAGDHVRLHVRDHGIGIAPDQLDSIFGSFVQQHREAAPMAGLGLGLAIVRSLVELHDGTVRAYSDGPGKGSELVVELPLISAARASMPTSELETYPAHRCGQTKRVLLVDDNADAAAMLGDALGTLGHEVLLAKDGPSALELAREFHPQIALLDIGLPEMDGYELARRLRDLPEVPGDVRLVAVSGFGQEGDRQRSREAGFAAHLVKPVRLDALIDAVRSAP